MHDILPILRFCESSPGGLYLLLLFSKSALMEPYFVVSFSFPGSPTKRFGLICRTYPPMDLAKMGN